MRKFQAGLLVAVATLAIAGCTKPAEESAGNATEAATDMNATAESMAPAADANAMDANAMDAGATNATSEVDPNGNPIKP